jgi:uncharacterized membrane protein
MESLLHDIARYVALAIQAIAIVIAAFGSARAVVDVFRSALGARPDLAPSAVWLDYARWLVAALTFQLAADIVATSFSPTWDELGRLAVVAAVRTFLSYFLDREMAAAAERRTDGRTRVGPSARPGAD